MELLVLLWGLESASYLCVYNQNNWKLESLNILVGRRPFTYITYHFACLILVPINIHSFASLILVPLT